MSDRVLFPAPGCVVETMQGNRPVVSWVLEARDNTVRLFAPGGRESKIAVSRLLPWYGPAHAPDISREGIEAFLDERAKTRDAIARDIDILEIWELAQGEVPRASAFWLAELAWENPDMDRVAAMGRAVLDCKTHFKFTPPDFEVYDAATVARRTAEQARIHEREALAGIGGEFFRALWGVHIKARSPLDAREYPPEEHRESFKRMLLDRIADPETHDNAETWKLLTKSLPDDPHLPLHLATAWGLIGPHHNFWLDRAGYDAGESWTDPHAGELAALAARVAEAARDEPETTQGCGGASFITIDPATTADFDDAFAVCKNADGTFSLSLAFACPARFWPFDTALDKAVLRRASSVYLPEGDHHMLPRETALSLFSLREGERRPAIVLEMTLSGDARPLAVTPRLSWIAPAANLSLPGCQAILDGPAATVPVTPRQIGAAAPFAAMLRDGLDLAESLQKRRIEAGAVITERPEPEVTASADEDGVVTVSVRHAPETPSAQLLVGEFMILANSVFAAWAVERDIPLLFRCQDVALPKEFAGVWTEPEDIARIVKHLPPSNLDTTPRPHAGLGAALYAPMTSPVRRYADLVNTAQIAAFVLHGRPRLDAAELAALLPMVNAFSDAVSQVQRFRPRYWKLLFYKQMGDKMWWDAVVTEENDAFAVLSLPLTRITVRARRQTMGEKVYPGQRVRVRLGKIDPLGNVIRVLAVAEQ